MRFFVLVQTYIRRSGILKLQQSNKQVEHMMSVCKHHVQSLAEKYQIFGKFKVMSNLGCACVKKTSANTITSAWQKNIGFLAKSMGVQFKLSIHQKSICKHKIYCLAKKYQIFGEAKGCPTQVEYTSKKHLQTPNIVLGKKILDFW